MTTLSAALPVLLAISHNQRVSKPRLVPGPSDDLAAPAAAAPLASIQLLLSLLGAQTAWGGRRNTVATAAAAAAAALLCDHPPAAVGLHRAVICSSLLSCLLRACPRRAAAHKHVQHPGREADSAVILVVQTLRCMLGAFLQVLELGAGTPLQEVPATGLPVHCRMWAAASSCDDIQKHLD